MSTHLGRVEYCVLVCLSQLDLEENGDGKEKKPMKNEITSCDDEICSDQRYIIYKIQLFKDILPFLSVM